MSPVANAGDRFSTCIICFVFSYILDSFDGTSGTWATVGLPGCLSSWFVCAVGNQDQVYGCM